MGNRKKAKRPSKGRTVTVRGMAPPKQITQTLDAAIARIGVHDHLCLIYKTQAEQFAAVIPFMRHGLERNEQCVYIADENTAQAVADALSADGVDVGATLASGALTIVSKQDTYLKGGRFDPDRMIRVLQESVAAAKAAGYSALRVTGEMTWALGSASGTERLIEYEGKLNTFFAKHDALAICQYNQKRFRPALLLDVIRTHPLVISGSLVCPNPHYIPPAELLSASRVAHNVERILEGLRERHRTEKTVHTFSQLGQQLNSAMTPQESARIIADAADQLLGWDAYTIDLYSSEQDISTSILNIDTIQGRRVEVPPVAVTGHKPTERMRRILEKGPELQLRKTGTSFQPDSIPFGDVTRPSLSLMFVPIRKGDKAIGVLSLQSYTVNAYQRSDLELLQSLADYCSGALERIRAAHEVLRSEERYRTLAESAPDMIFVIDSADCVQYVNAAGARALRRQPLDIIGKPRGDLFPPQTAELQKNDLQQVFKTGLPVTRENQIVFPDGVHWLNTDLNPLRNPGGEVREVMGVSRDFTERKRAEAQARLLAHTVESISDAVSITDMEDTVVFTNKAFLELYGYREEEVLGKNISIVRSPNNPPDVVRQILPETLNGGWQGELVNIKKDGSEFVVHLSTSIVQDQQRIPVALVGVARDITERMRTERSLQASEAHLRAVHESLTEGVVFLGTDGIVKSANDAVTKLLGRSLQELSDPELDPRWRIVRSDGAPFPVQEQPAIVALRTGNPVRDVEMGVPSPDGTMKWILVNAQLVRDTDGTTLGAVASFFDITDRKQAEAALVKSQTSHAEASRIAHLGHWELDLTTNQLDWSAEVFRIFEIDPKAFGATYGNFLDTVHPEDRAFVDHAFTESVKNRTPYDIVHRLLMKDGSIKFVNDRCETSYDESGKPLRSIGTVQDITDRTLAERRQEVLYKIAQAALSAESLESLFKDIHAIVGSAMTAKNFYVALYDRENDQISFPYFVDEVNVVPPKGPAVKGLTAYVLRTGQSLLCDQQRMDQLVSRGDVEQLGAASPIWLGVPLLAKGRAIGAVVVQDYVNPCAYTERERMLLEFVSTEIAQAIERTRIEQEIKERDAVLEALSFAADEFLRGEWDAIMPAVLRRLGQATGVSRVYVFERRIGDNGEPFVSQRYEWVATGIRPEIDNPDLQNLPLKASGFGRWEELLAKNQTVYGNVRDFPLSEQEVLLSQSIESIAIVPITSGTTLWGFMGFDQCFSQRSWSSPVREALRVAGNILGDAIHSARTHALLVREQAYFKQLFEGSPIGIVMLTKESNVLDANKAFKKMFQYSLEEMKGKKIDELIVPEHLINEASQLTVKSVASHVIYQETKRTRKDGGLIDVAITAYPIVLEGDVVGVFGEYLDVGEKKQLEEHIRQAQKMESLGTLAGGIAHDFNNILGIIMAQASLMEGTQSDRSDVPGRVDAILKAAERGASVVKQLLTFARKTDAYVESVRVNRMVVEIKELARETFPKTIVIETELEDDLPSISADATQIHQMMLNLCLNARDAMPRGGTLTITTGKVGSDLVLSKHPEADAKEYILFRVADTGIGIDEPTQKRIFEPFFTTKELGKGTGLGLSLVFGIVESQRGFIDVESAVGKGTTFTVYLPVTERSMMLDHSEGKDVKAVAGGSETVLVIEDERDIRETVELLLVAKGYTVLIAADGKEAIDVYSQHAEEIDIVISDLGLPVVDGQEVITRIKSIDPNAKVILASGFIDPRVKSELVVAGVRTFILKPYTANEVLQKIREVLDSRDA